MKVWLFRSSYGYRSYQVWNANPDKDSCANQLVQMTCEVANLFGLPYLQENEGRKYELNKCDSQDRLRHCERRNSELANENEEIKKQLHQESEACDECLADLTEEKLRTELEAVKQGMDGMMQLVSLFKKEKEKDGAVH